MDNYPHVVARSGGERKTRLPAPIRVGRANRPQTVPLSGSRGLGVDMAADLLAPSQGDPSTAGRPQPQPQQSPTAPMATPMTPSLDPRRDRALASMAMNRALRARSVATFAQNAPMPSDPMAAANRIATVDRYNQKADMEMFALAPDYFQRRDAADTLMPHLPTIATLNAMPAGSARAASAGQGQQQQGAPLKERAEAFTAMIGQGIAPDQALAHLDALAPVSSSPAAPMTGAPVSAPAQAISAPQAPPPPAPPAPAASQGGGKKGIEMSEQIAREMWRVIHEQHANQPDGMEYAAPAFRSKMGEYGVDGGELLGKWKGEGSLNTFDFRQPGDKPQPVAPQPQVVVPPDRAGGRGGLVDMPDGSRIVVDQYGGRAPGPPVSQGAPMPTGYVMPKPRGPQPGFTPAPMIRPPQQQQTARAQQPSAGIHHGAGGGAPSIPQVRSAQEYAALPAGTEYIDPNGQRKRKQ